MIKIDVDTVTEILAKVARGELPATTSHDGSCSWTIRSDGFVIEIFDDSNKVDYVERVTDPGGYLNFCRITEPKPFGCGDLLYGSNKISVPDSADAEPGMSERLMPLRRVVSNPE